MNILKATKRSITSSGKVNKLRSEGFIPAILYGGKKNNLSQILAIIFEVEAVDL